MGFLRRTPSSTSYCKLVAIRRPSLAKDALASSPTQGEVGIEGWNESDEYTFVYVNPKKGTREVVVKCLAIDGGKLLVDAVAEGGTEHAHLKIRFLAKLRSMLLSLEWRVITMHSSRIWTNIQPRGTSSWGKKLYDHKVDVYSCAIVFWELLTNKIPFKGKNNIFVAYAASKNQRPSLNNLPAGVGSLLEACWAADPKARPEFKEITVSLEKLLRSLCSDDDAEDQTINLVQERVVYDFPKLKMKTTKKKKNKVMTNKI
ncbi:Protein kinase domain protein [Raphanus sativus]|nr:Protein kinase domain protein [Raphanus sativus]